MASNLIQIKRSTTNPSIPALNPGELAFTQNGNTFYIGAPDNIAGNIRIGGEMVPGTLTANQALVANSTGGIDRVYTSNLDVNFITANGSPGGSGYILTSSGTGGNVYWNSVASLSVDQSAQYNWTNTHTFTNTVTFSGTNGIRASIVNASSYTTGAPGAGIGGISANVTTIIVGNNTINTVITSAGLNVNGASIVNNSGVYTTGTVNTSTFNTGDGSSATGGVSINTTAVSVGNTSVNGAISTNSTASYFTGTAWSANNSLSVGGNTASDLRAYSDTAYANAVTYAGTIAATAYGNAIAYAATIAGTAYVNAASYTDTHVGTAYTNAMADTLTRNGTYTGNNIFNGTNTVFGSNVVISTNNISLSSAYAKLTFGNPTQLTNTLVVSANLYTPYNNWGPTIALGSPGNNGPGGELVYAPHGGSFDVAGNLFFSNTSLLQVGNSSAYINVTSGTIYLNGGGVTATINSTSYSGAISTATNASQLGGIAAANYVQNTDSRTLSGNLYFTGTNTVFGTGNVTFNGSIANNFIPAANNTYTLGNNTMRWSSLYVSGSTVYIGNSSISVDAANNITFGGANSVTLNTASVNTISGTGAAITVTSNLNITSSNVNMTSANVAVKDLNVSGNLTVSGTLTTIDTVNLQVKDPLIKLADNNSATDLVEIGFYGISGNTSATYYSGIVRNHSASGASLTDPVFTVFATTTEPTGIIDDTAAGYKIGSLRAYLQPYGLNGAFIANSTVVNITANSTVSSALVANSLTLTTALAATYGGTGQSVYAVGDLLYASGTTALSKLSVPGTVANGQVLQINNNLPSYGTLDGGSF